MVVKNALSYSRKIGIYTAIGIGSGIIIHILYTFLGIGLLIKESPQLFQTIKYIGGLYIVYMGIQSFMSNSNSKIVQQDFKKSISAFKALKIGFITNVFNPKASLFFLSLFTLVLKPETPVKVLAILGLLLVLQTTLWFVIVSFFFTQKAIQKKYFQYENLINKIFGIILILLAIKVIFF